MSFPKYNYHAPTYSEHTEYVNRRAKWQGIWITYQITQYDFETSDNKVRTVYECSICQSKFHGDYLFPTKFCPNCGADMRGDTDAREK